MCPYPGDQFILALAVHIELNDLLTPERMVLYIGTEAMNLIKLSFVFIPTRLFNVS